jgi:tRNA-modifying protein YgfZ
LGDQRGFDLSVALGFAPHPALNIRAIGGELCWLVVERFAYDLQFRDGVVQTALAARRKRSLQGSAKAAYLTISVLASATGGERMSEKAASLEDRGVVRVTGADAAVFLQGLLTNDVERLGPSEARYAALLTPQGKILFDMIAVRAPDADGAVFFLDCSAAQAADLAKRLGFYKLRAKVAIADESSGRAVAAFWGDEPASVDGGILYADPRDPRLGWRAILPRPVAAALGSERANEYEGLRIGTIAPKGGVDFAYGEAFPHDVNLDLLHGLDFDKGCYVGQEVVSRMKHRGTARRRVVRVKLAGPPPPPGTPILDRELTVGALGSSSGREALALLRLDRVEDAAAAGRTLSAGGVGLTLAE